jgi:hypothetical protein
VHPENPILLKTQKQQTTNNMRISYADIIGFDENPLLDESP